MNDTKDNDLFSISGKVVVITGAGGALCGVISEKLASLACKVALLDINSDASLERAEKIRHTGGTAKSFYCNVLDEQSLINTHAAVVESFGQVDALINGAGGNNPKGSTDLEYIDVKGIDNPEVKDFFDLSVEGFSQTFDLNFLGSFLPVKIFAKDMVRRGKGNIINFSSMSALNPLTKVAAYSAAKAAVANFTRWLAVHFSKSGIRVNALSPGFFMTEQLRFLHINQETGELTPRARKVITHTPLGRYGEPEELVGTVVWLLSEASSFVTGSVIPVDGGFSSYSI
jgi:NAD(P)-dependent dehydrogenase (short-subunit alcohol dehydrogenase family)